MDKDGIAIDLNSGNALEVFRNLQHEDHVPRFLPALRRQPLRQTSVMQFGTYEVSLQSGEVRKAGVKIRVQQQPMKLLKILLERPGEVVTREELRGRVWADESFGDFDQAVNIAVGKLRSALGDSAENPGYIEILPKRGYRFIAEVSVVAGDDRTKKQESATRTIPGTDSGQQIQGAQLVVEPKHRQWPASRIMGALALALFLSLAILAVWLFRSRGPAPTGIRSLAVLPLATSLAMLRRIISPMGHQAKHFESLDYACNLIC